MDGEFLLDCILMLAARSSLDNKYHVLGTSFADTELVHTWIGS
jgi:hypothetical protein